MTVGAAMHGKPLELAHGIRGNGPRHYLDGREVHAGDALEVRTFAGAWLRGRYEWTFRTTDRPELVIALASAETEEGTSAALPLSPGALLRWPEAH